MLVQRGAPLLAVLLAAELGQLCLKVFVHGLRERRDRLGGSLDCKRIAAVPRQRAIVKSPGAGVGELHHISPAKSDIRSLAANDDPLDPPAG